MHQNDELWRRAGGEIHGTNPIRSFDQIARMIAAREGKSMSPLRVMRICRVAEGKLVKALLGDPAIGSPLGNAAALVN